MKKFLLETFYIIDSIPSHKIIKPLLLEEIDKINFENDNNSVLKVVDDYYNDNISKLDWHDAQTDKQWKEILLPHLSPKLLDIANANGYKNVLIDELWFQQYQKEGQHGWHTHGSNFTGVYYLELPKSAPKTELVTPYNYKHFIPEIQEGDLLIFPSFVVHRAPVITKKLRKTIVSFNITMTMLTDIFLQSLYK